MFLCKSLYFLLFLLSLTSSTYQQSYDFPFQKIIWTAWSSYIETAPIFVQACIKSIQIFAKQNNFTFIILNRQNLPQYLENYQYFEQIRSKSTQPRQAHRADLIRTMIIAQHGGLWLDATTIFPYGLEQIKNIMNPKYTSLFINNFSPEPNVMMFYNSNGQNRVEYLLDNPYYNELDPTYNSNPNLKQINHNAVANYEIWAIAAKKNTPLMKKIRDNYIKFTCTFFHLVQNNIFLPQNIYLIILDNWSDYFYLNMAVTYTIQTEQKILDRQLTLFGKRKYAQEKYKLWGLNGEIGPLITVDVWTFQNNDLFYYSIEEMEKKSRRILFFLKYTGFYRDWSQKKFNYLINIFSQRNLTFEGFLKTQPSTQQCDNILFIIEGSVMDKVLKQTNLEAKYGLKTITKQQHLEWQSYCSSRTSLTPKIIRFIEQSFILQILKPLFTNQQPYTKSRVQQKILQFEQKYEGRKVSLYEWIGVRFRDNRFLIVYFMVVILWCGTVFWLYRRFISIFINLFRKQINDKNNTNYKENEYSLEQNNRYNGNQYKSVQNQPDKNIKNSQSHLIQKDQNSNKNKIANLLIVVIFVMNLTAYNAVDLTGGREQPYAIFFVILLSMILQTYVQNTILKLENSKSKHYVPLKSKYQLFLPFFNYVLADLAIIKMVNHKFILITYSLLISQLSSNSIKLYFKLLKSNKSRNIHCLNFMYSINKNIHRYIIILLLITFLIMPNLYYLANQNGYYVRYLPCVALLYLFIIFVQMVYECLRKRYVYELVRLGYLLIITGMVIYRFNDMIRVGSEDGIKKYVLRGILTFSMVYLQLGTSLEFNFYKKFKHSKTFLNFVFFFPLMFELLLGGMGYGMGKLNPYPTDYLVHAMIFVYNISLSALFMVMDQKVRWKQDGFQVMNQQKNISSHSNEEIN